MPYGKRLFVAAALASQAVLAGAATAATCADRTHVVEQLNTRFGEALRGNAVSRSGAILEIYSNSASQSWTILVTLPDRDLTCLVASGTGHNRLNMQLADLSG